MINFLIIDILTKFIPLVLISYYYWKVYKEIKKSQYFIPVNDRYNSLRLLWFPLTCAICFMPDIVGHLIIILRRQLFSQIVMSIIFGYLLRIWILFNLLGYWFLKPQLKEEKVCERDSMLSLISTDL